MEINIKITIDDGGNYLVYLPELGIVTIGTTFADCLYEIMKEYVWLLKEYTIPPYKLTEEAQELRRKLIIIRDGEVNEEE